MRRTLSLFAFLFLTVFAKSASAQTVADIIRGRITGPDSQPIVNASINVVSAQGGISKTGKTDRNGRFSVVFPNGEGDYFVYISAIGFQQKRFQVKRIADEEVLLADSRLAPAQLETVNVVAQGARQTATRADNAGDISGNTRGVGNGAVSAADAGNLAALAATLPGFQLIPGLDGNPDLFSALGLSPDQNNSTLNGASSAGLDLPRDAQTATSVSAGSWDISQGGFSGAQIQVRTLPGNNYKNRGVSGNGNPEQIQITDDVGDALSATRSYYSIGGNLSGPVKMDRAFYNFSLQADRTAQDLQTLFNTDPLGLTSAGIAPDSASRFRSILQSLNIPIGMPSIPSGIERYALRSQGVLDFQPSSASAHAFQLSMQANTNFPAAGSTGLLATPTVNGESKFAGATVGGRHTMYLWQKVISETWLTGSMTENSTDAYLRFPGGNVRVGSELDDASSSVRTLRFGGSPVQSDERSNVFGGLKNQLRWFSTDSRHTFKLTSEVRTERNENTTHANQLGSFSFLSLGDLESGLASSYSRALAPVHGEASQISGNISLGDSWRPTTTFQATFGVRLDANRFLTRPDFNPAVESAFGVRNDHAPNRVYPSAVAGFSWQYGQASQIPVQQGFVNGPRATILAGIRLFQNVRGADLINGATSSTGLPGSALTLICTGPATPTPDWDAYRTNPGAAPGECADGSSQFATSLPSVVMFDPRFNQSRSIRPSITWRGAILDNRFSANINAIHSINLDQQSQVDLNFNPSQRFALDNEGGRPVFAPADAIDSRTGAIAPNASRVSSEFNSVSSIRSNLRSQSSQASISINPLTFQETRFTWGVGYTWQYVRDQFNGFSSTVGNPLERHWSVNQGARHSINYSLSYNFWDYVRVGYSGSFTSGQRYTPTVAGDVNGDNAGFNDRAFIFDPSSASDPALAAGMQALMANGSSSARDCLRDQLGQLASRNSCVGPWTVGGGRLNISIQPIKLKLPPRATINLSIDNPLAAADILINGSDHIKGWGQPRNPDASLLFKRGFDPATQRFTYEVNERFGATDSRQTTQRVPVTVNVSVRLDVGPTRDWQNVKMQLDRGRRSTGNRVTEAQIKSVVTNAVMNPMARVLQTADILGLTRKQADSLAALSRGFTLTLDSIWTPVAKFYGGMDSTYSESDAHERFVRGREAAANYLIKIGPSTKKLFTKAQWRRLPSGITNFFEPRYLERVRAGSALGGIGIPIFF